MKTYKLTINGDKYEAKVVEYSGTHAKINVNGHDFLIQIEDDAHPTLPKLEQDKAVPIAPAMSSSAEAFNGEVRAPIPGVIVSIPVKEGDKVSKGQPIIIIEAMKMQSEIASPVDGTIGKINSKERAPVQEGDILMFIESAEIKEKPVTPRNSKATTPQPETKKADGMILAPIPGVVLDILVSIGDNVTNEQSVLILEAMKMESEIHSGSTGRVKKIHVSKGASVQEGDPLIELEV